MPNFGKFRNSVYDSRVTDEVANHLFEEDKKPKSGMDLVALNLQRGRDHGIPGYNKYRLVSLLLSPSLLSIL